MFHHTEIHEVSIIRNKMKNHKMFTYLCVPKCVDPNANSLSNQAR